MSTNTELTRGQRLGLGVVAMFYGELVAAVLLALAITLRNVGNLAFLKTHIPDLLRIILVSVGLEGCVAALAFLMFAMPLIGAWSPSRLRSLGAWFYASAGGVGILSLAVLWLAMFRSAHATHEMPRLTPTVMFVTFLFSTVVALVAFWRYFALVKQASNMLAKHREKTRDK